MLPTVLVALGAGAAVVAVSVHGIPDGLTGVPLAVPVPLVAGITAGAAALGLLAALVATRIALRTSPAEAMRERRGPDPLGSRLSRQATCANT